MGLVDQVLYAPAVVANRVVNYVANWRLHTTRSVLETYALVGAGYLTYLQVQEQGIEGTTSIGYSLAGALAGFLVYAVASQLVFDVVDGPEKEDWPVNNDPSKVYREEDGVTRLVDSVFWSARRKQQYEGKTYTMEEIRKHDNRQDAWICVEGRVYDVTKYVESHPGGWLPIANLAGRDVTDAFANYHPARVYEKLLPQYYIGDVEDYHVSEFVAAHREIRQDLLRRNQFETKQSFYIQLYMWYASLFVGGLYLTIFQRDWQLHMVGACCFALAWQQSAFWGHDVGHNAITHHRNTDLPLGIIAGNITGGISMAWWKRSHNVHHVVCNSIEMDPDIQHMPLFAVDKEIFGKFWSTYHQREVVTDWIARTLVSYQHILYYPIMAVARFNLYAQSYLLLLSKEDLPFKSIELWTLVGFATWFSIMVVTCLDSWVERVAFLLLSHGIAGILHVQICISHFAEDTYHGKAYNDESDEWFRMQVRGCLNVDCPTWMDWFHGGLQFQLEHHLFPRLPRHNLRACRNIIKPFCEKQGLEYKEAPFVAANVKVVSKLYETAQEARKLTKGDAGFYTSAIHHGLNAIG